MRRWVAFTLSFLPVLFLRNYNVIKDPHTSGCPSMYFPWDQSYLAYFHQSPIRPIYNIGRSTDLYILASYLGASQYLAMKRFPSRAGE